MAKKQYIAPTLKEHGIVREITQSGSGGRNPGKDMGMGFGQNNNPGMSKN